MTPDDPSQRRKGVLLVASGALLYAPDSLLLRLMNMPPWETMFWRGLIAGSALVLLFVILHGRNYPARILALGPAGFAYLAAYVSISFFFVHAVLLTSVANSLFLVSTSPVFSALISWGALGERPDRRTARTIFLCLAGVGLIAAGGAEGGGPNSLLGDLCALGAALSLAVSFVIARTVRPLDMTPMVGPANLAAAAIAALVAGASLPPEASIPPLLAMALIVSPGGTLCLTLGPRYIPAPEVSLLLLIEAVIGPLIIWAALGENPGAWTFAGGSVILAGLAWSNVERLRRNQVQNSPRPDGVKSDA